MGRVGAEVRHAQRDLGRIKASQALREGVDLDEAAARRGDALGGGEQLGEQHDGCSNRVGRAHALHYTVIECRDRGGPMNINKESTSAKVRKASPAEACALEKLPHITKRVCLLWGHPEFDALDRKSTRLNSSHQIIS